VVCFTLSPSVPVSNRREATGVEVKHAEVVEGVLLHASPLQSGTQRKGGSVDPAIGHDGNRSPAGQPVTAQITS
jgi:hypothetical protein